MVTVSTFALVGILLGWGSWVMATRLTTDAQDGTAQYSRPSLAPPLIASGLTGALFAIAAHRSGNDLRGLATVAILTAPLVVTVLTDLLARLVFPAVLASGLVAALAVAAVGPLGLEASVISGAVAAAVATLLVVVSRRLWPHSAETPLGSGEILIAATAGAMLGPAQTPSVLFVSMVLAAAVAGILLRTGSGRRDDPIPYGACLCACALVAVAL